MQASTGIPLDLATVIQSAVVLFVATPVLVKEIFRLRAAPTATMQLATKGGDRESRQPHVRRDVDTSPEERSHPRDRRDHGGHRPFFALRLGLGSTVRSHAALSFTPLNLVNAPWHLGSLTVATRWTDIVLSLIIVALAAEVFIRQPSRGVMPRFGVAAILFLVTLLFWARAPTGRRKSIRSTSPRSSSAVSDVMVLVFGSLSGVMCERSGVVNIAIEGQFIAGAFLGSMIASTTGNFFYAAIAGAFVGGLIGLVLAFFALRYQSDQIIVGIVLVTMLSSLSSYLNLQSSRPSRTSTPATSHRTWRSPCSRRFQSSGRCSLTSRVLLSHDRVGRGRELRTL